MLRGVLRRLCVMGEPSKAAIRPLWDVWTVLVARLFWCLAFQWCAGDDVRMSWGLLRQNGCVRGLRTFVEYLRRPANRASSSCSDAERRGFDLLHCNLSVEQREQYATDECFDVIGGETGKRYRIRPGHQMNVQELDQQGRPIRLLCFTPRGRVPVGDVMLAQKLALELFEDEAIRIAKRAWNFTLSEQESGIARRYPRL
jgi:hypothetical protein